MSKLSSQEKLDWYVQDCNLKKLQQLVERHDDLVIIPDMTEYEDLLSWSPEDRLYHAAKGKKWEVLKLLINYHIAHYINAFEGGSDEYLHGQSLLRAEINALVDEDEIELPAEVRTLCEKVAPSDGDVASDTGFDDISLSYINEVAGDVVHSEEWAVAISGAGAAGDVVDDA